MYTWGTMDVSIYQLPISLVVFSKPILSVCSNGNTSANSTSSNSSHINISTIYDRFKPGRSNPINPFFERI